MAFEWLTENSRTFLSRGYLSEGETPEQRIRFIADHAEKLLGIEGYADKFYEYMGRGWFSLSTPVWTNFGKERGLPVSCFNSHVTDDVGGILYAQGEVGAMSKIGGGTSGYFGDVRPRGSSITDNGESTGSVHFMELFQTTTNVISQGSSRRGRMAPYLPLSHGDIMEFLDIGTEGHPIQDMNHGVIADDWWLQEMVDGDKEKRKIWAKVIQRRSELGYPYIMFRDNANTNTVDVYKDKGYRINSSNLCLEIFLPSTEDESFTCVLSSMNLLHYDDWKTTDAVEVLTYFLDAVAEEFIQKLEQYRDTDERDKQLIWYYMQRAYKFTKNHRALGLGVLGWHSLLQSKMIAFESRDAAKLNLEIFKLLKEKTYKASKELANMFGEPDVLKGYGRRNTTLIALAPTASSSFILGQVSPSIEPVMSNCYVKDLAKVKTVIKNPFLEKLLIEKGHNTKEVWDNIIKHDGSVLGLPDGILTEEEKDVFLTFAEISQYAIIDQAATRQVYIDQGQSLNLKLLSNMTPKEINELYLYAWKMGIKGLYYAHSVNAAQQFLRDKKQCIACEG